MLVEYLGQSKLFKPNCDTYLFPFIKNPFTALKKKEERGMAAKDNS